MVETRRVYAGRSADERDGRRRRQLLDAGLEVFGTTGFRTATVRGLCREAHVADRSFYELYATTEELLLGVYRDCIGRLMSAVGEALAAADTDDDLVAVTRRGLDAFFTVVSDRRVARVVWLEVLGVSSEVDAEYVATMDAFGAMLFSQMRSRIPAVGASPVTETLVSAAVGGIRHIGTKWFLEEFAVDRATIVDGCTVLLITLATAASDGREAETPPTSGPRAGTGWS